ncbi:MAG: bifunctional ornithine acetyltransferase/N-acetylglutamate synthase [Candidatus Nanopelagicaceae bacterium]
MAAEFDPANIDVKLNGIQVCKGSAPAADRNLVSFEDRLVEIEINLNAGTASATILTNDLTHDYVHENSAYAT